MKKLDVIAATLVVVGALNWGLVAVAKFDLVAALFGMRFGETSALTAVVYGLVGFAGIYQGLGWKGIQRRWRLQTALAATVAFAALATAAVPASAGCGGSHAAKAMKSTDIVSTAVAAGDFETLAAALQAAGLVETLQGKGPFTVFAPTDEAFAKLPKGTVEDLLKPENKDKLTGILTYHVVPGKVMAEDVIGLESAQTVNGQTVAVVVRDGVVSVGGARVTKTDIECSNGVIHVIDTVMLPK
jgi:uncharacterized surface protein with fasciclin (FAS1) repeats/uncharacterized membrane protein YuzA (DUF378 family)